MSNHESQMERGAVSNGKIDLDKIESEDHLRNVLTNTMTLSPEMFEKLYLGPKSEVKGDLRKTFANPTPMARQPMGREAVMGFSVAVLPISISLMGWGGAGGFAAGTVPCSIFFGGILLTVAGLLEWILGNNFPFLVFFGYGAHILTFATTFMPSFDAIGWYSKGDPYKITPGFAFQFTYYPVALGLLSFVFLLGSLRTNLIFVLLFVSATTAFGFGTAGVYYTGTGNPSSTWCIQATGACFFVCDVLGWYLFLAQMIQMMELPFPDLPVFDLSTVIKAKSRLPKEE